MKTVILCGGLGTRISEETQSKPKPMVEIGGKPILWHILKIYEQFGFEDFILALGYKGEAVKNYFLNYHALQSNLLVRVRTGAVEYSNPMVEDWKISLVDTGAKTMTGGRLGRLRDTLTGSGTFMLTYGDGLANINITELLKFHRSHGRIATVTAVRPSARFGGIQISSGVVKHFREKPQSGEGWINGGFFVFEPDIFKYIKDDMTVLEKEPLEALVRDRELMAYEHEGFWQCMDTIRDRDVLQAMWDTGEKPWLIR